MRYALFCLLVSALTLGIVGDAAAYVGPGAGLSLVGAFWGLAVAVLAAFSFVILWPFRRLFRRASTARQGKGLASSEAKAPDRAA
jgi:membrane protein implicated in regulation of membrane protease activity